MSNTKLFQTTFSNTEAPARILYAGLTERLDAAQAAKVDKPEGDTLEKRLQSLDAKKKEKLKITSQAELKRLAETLNEKDWEKVADKVHKLSEWHKREVGTAVEIGKNEYLLVHASNEALQLVIEDQTDKSPAALKAALDKVGIAYDAKTYTKDKIPTAKPLSKYTEGKTKTKLAAYPSTAGLEAQAYNQALDEVKAAAKTQPEVPSPADILTAGKNYRYKVALNRLYGRGNIPEEIARVFNLAESKIDGERLKTDPAYAKEQLNSVFRAGSTRQFEAKIREAQAANKGNDRYISDLEATLAAFKVMDITYGNVEGSSPEKRLATMDSRVKKLSGLENFDAKQLFASKENGAGVDVDWQKFYKESAKGNSKLAKHQLESILSGGEVQMLRVDRKANSSDQFEAFIDQMPGSALKGSINVPQEVRNEKDYVYKYKTLSGVEAQAAIANYRKNHPELEKVLSKLSAAELANCFNVAQVEIPNCENPAIVVKPHFETLQNKPIPVVAPVEEASECEDTVGILRAFENVPGGIGLVFRPLDWFTDESKKNYLADPAIVDLKGKVLREDEYLNASKRLSIKFKKRLNDGADKIVGEDETLPKFLKQKTTVDGKEITNKEALDLLVKSLQEKVAAAGQGKTEMEALNAKATAFKEWKDGAMQDAGYSYNKKRLVRLAEFAYKENLPTADKMQSTLKREQAAYDLLKFKQDWKTTIFESGKNFSQLRKELPQTYNQVMGLLKELNIPVSDDAVVRDVVEKALYERQNLNIARPPEFAGDVMVIPPHKYDQLTMHRMGSELGKEFANVNSPLGHMVQAAIAISGFLIYIKTGTGIPDDLPEIYREKIKEIERNGGDPKTILGEIEFKDFERFIRTGELGCGKQVLSIPVNEVRLLIPGWNLLEGFVGGGASASCPTASAGGSSGAGAAGGGL